MLAEIQKFILIINKETINTPTKNSVDIYIAHNYDTFNFSLHFYRNPKSYNKCFNQAKC